MENRQYKGQSVYSECLNLETTIKNIIAQDDFVGGFFFGASLVPGFDGKGWWERPPFLVEYILKSKHSIKTSYLVRYV
jgi:hypothetical protein